MKLYLTKLNFIFLNLLFFKLKFLYIMHNIITYIVLRTVQFHT